MFQKKLPQEAAGHNSVPSNKPDYCGSRSFNWFEITFNWFQFTFNWFQFTFNLLSIYFQFTLSWFQITLNLLSIDFNLLPIYFQSTSHRNPIVVPKKYHRNTMEIP